MRLLRYIYTGYVAIIFIIFILITTPFFLLLSFLFGNKALGAMLFLCKFIAFGFGALCGIFYRFHNREKMEKNQPYMLIANHRSNLDAPVSAAACRGRVRYLGKKELLKIPVLGLLFKVTIVIVDRSSPESRRKSILKLQQFMKEGDSIFIFPEGTRNKTTDKALIDFKDGAFRIAIDLQAPILPMLYINSDRIMPNKPLIMRPGVVDVYYLDEIKTAGMNETNITALKEQVHKMMKEKYLELTENKKRSR